MATAFHPMASGTPRLPWVRTLLALVALSALGWSFGAATAWAQRAGNAKGGLTKAEFMAVLRGGNISDKPAFDAYATKEILTPFGVSGPPADPFFQQRRQLKIYLTTARSGQAHDELNRLTLAKMKEIVGGSKYDSAAKINAMYVIGELNDVDEPGKGKPLPEAFPILWAIIANPKLQAQLKVGDELKIAALVGLDHFAATGTLQKKDDVAKFMLALVKQKDPPPKHSPDAHNWMRRQAAAILVKMGGVNADFINALAAIAADPTTRTAMRCDMAQLIGQAKITPAAKVDVQALAGSLGHQAVDICTAEIDKSQQEKRDLKMRLIMYTLYSVREALGGLQAAAADTPHKKLVGDLYNKVKTIHAELDDPELAMGTLTIDVPKKIKELQTMLPPKAPVATQEMAAAAAEKRPVESAKQ